MALRGSCLCGAVAFRSDADWRDAVSCHCNECRKQSGHFFAAAPVPRDGLAFDRDDGLRWYNSSDQARRGFCATCGATLFFDFHGSDKIFIAGGVIDGPTGGRIARQMWVEEKGDYYELDAIAQTDIGFGADGPEALK